MNRQEHEIGVDRETRRWVFDAVAWLAGIVLAAALVAEAAAGAGTGARQDVHAEARQHAAALR